MITCAVFLGCSSVTKFILADNDIYIKCCCYDLSEEMVEHLTIGGTPPAMLAVGRFVVRNRLQRHQRASEPERALAAFNRILEKVELLEPTEKELDIAADLEQAALESGLELDAGESQLFAILQKRELPLMVTGDKRAISALEHIVGDPSPSGCIACFEQLVLTMLSQLDIERIRTAVCREKTVDRTMAICFSGLSDILCLRPVSVSG